MRIKDANGLPYRKWALLIAIAVLSASFKFLALKPEAEREPESDDVSEVGSLGTISESQETTQKYLPTSEVTVATEKVSEPRPMTLNLPDQSEAESEVEEVRKTIVNPDRNIDAKDLEAFNAACEKLRITRCTSRPYIFELVEGDFGPIMKSIDQIGPMHEAEIDYQQDQEC